jgi:hypothetical protein
LLHQPKLKSPIGGRLEITRQKEIQTRANDQDKNERKPQVKQGEPYP